MKINLSQYYELPSWFMRVPGKQRTQFGDIARPRDAEILGRIIHDIYPSAKDQNQLMRHLVKTIKYLAQNKKFNTYQASYKEKFNGLTSATFKEVKEENIKVLQTLAALLVAGEASLPEGDAKKQLAEVVANAKSSKADTWKAKYTQVFVDLREEDKQDMENEKAKTTFLLTALSNIDQQIPNIKESEDVQNLAPSLKQRKICELDMLWTLISRALDILHAPYSVESRTGLIKTGDDLKIPELLKNVTEKTPLLSASPKAKQLAEKKSSLPATPASPSQDDLLQIDSNDQVNPPNILASLEKDEEKVDSPRPPHSSVILSPQDETPSKIKPLPALPQNSASPQAPSSSSDTEITPIFEPQYRNNLNRNSVNSTMELVEAHKKPRPYKNFLSKLFALTLCNPHFNLVRGMGNLIYNLFFSALGFGVGLTLSSMVRNGRSDTQEWIPGNFMEPDYQWAAIGALVGYGIGQSFLGRIKADSQIRTDRSLHNKLEELEHGHDFNIV